MRVSNDLPDVKALRRSSRHSSIAGQKVVRSQAALVEVRGWIYIIRRIAED
jgi:hypothetical protein